MPKINFRACCFTTNIQFTVEDKQSIHFSAKVLFRVGVELEKGVCT